MRTALIVEDDPDQAQMAASFLRHRRIEPRIAPDGLTGLAQIAESIPDVVLLDLMLPDVDGFEVCRRLRLDPRTHLTPVVMVTALHDDDRRKHGFRVGADVYLTKPYGPTDLFNALELAQSRSRGLVEARARGEIQIEFNSSSQFLREVNDFLVELYRTTPLATEQIQHLQQVVLELGQNAIEWGNGREIDRLVRLTYRVFADRVEVVIRDEGSGFDPESLPHAASSDDPLSHMDVRESLGLREGGFGLLICRGMVDELSYNEAGNEVRLVKRYPADGLPDTLRTEQMDAPETCSCPQPQA
jgi:DNA-binding response OmpR family regulator